MELLLHVLAKIDFVPGLMKFLGKGTTGKIVEDSEEKLESLLRTFLQNLQNKYNRYAFAFFGCELLNLVMPSYSSFKESLGEAIACRIKGCVRLVLNQDLFSKYRCLVE